MKKSIILLLSIGAAFLLGFLLRGLVIEPGPKSVEQNENTVNPTENYPEKADDNTLGKEAQKKYYELIAEYMDYIKQDGREAPIALDEFVSIRRDRLIQQDKYTANDESLDNEILEWYGLTENNESEKVFRSYSISGNIKGSNINDLKDNELLVGSLFNPIKDQSPIIPYGHIAFERPLQYTYINDLAGSFDLNVDILENTNGETDPIYILAMMIPNINPHNTRPIMAGTDNSIFGVPASMLARRKNNEPIKINLKALSSSFDRSDLDIINIHDGSIVSLYGVDQINKLDSSIGILRTVISSKDNTARLKSLPTGSTIMLSSPNNNTGFWFETELTGRDNKINLEQKPSCRNNSSCLSVIRPLGVKSPEITIYSKNPKLKLSKALSNQKPWSITTPVLKEAFLELKSQNKTLGIMRINTLENKTGIIEPVYKNIGTLTGNIKKIISPGSHKDCAGCKITIKFSEKEAVCSSSGRFMIEDIDLIDSYMNILVEDKDVDAVVNIPVVYSHKDLRLNSSVPSYTALRSWNMTAPTMPSNTLVYGEIPYHKSYRAFLVGVDNDLTKEAVYFNRLDTPDRKIYSTQHDPNSAGFAKFIFPDIPKGKYVLHLISGDDIIHSRIIYIDKNGAFVLN